MMLQSLAFVSPFPVCNVEKTTKFGIFCVKRRICFSALVRERGSRVQGVKYHPKNFWLRLQHEPYFRRFSLHAKKIHVRGMLTTSVKLKMGETTVKKYQCLNDENQDSFCLDWCNRKPLVC